MNEPEYQERASRAGAIDIDRIRELVGERPEVVSDADLAEALQLLPGHSISFSVLEDGSLSSTLTMGDVELVLNALDEAKRRGFDGLRPARVRAE